MKRLYLVWPISVLLIGMLCFSLMGCAFGGDTPTKTQEPTKTGTTTVSNDKPKATSKPDASSEDVIDFETLTLVDTDVCLVAVESFKQDKFWGPSFEFYLENRSEQALMFSIDDVSVNDFMCDPFWATEVAPGKKAYSNVSWSESSLEENGIRYIQDVEFTLTVYDAEDWYADNFVDQVLSISVPHTTTAPATEEVVFEDGFTEQSIVETNQIKVIAKSFDEDGMWGPALTLYIENQSDQNLSFSLDDVSVNGFMCDPYWMGTVRAGKKTYARVDWAPSTLEENRIETFEEIEFTLRVYDSDDFMADDVLLDTFRIVVD